MELLNDSPIFSTIGALNHKKGQSVELASMRSKRHRILLSGNLSYLETGLRTPTCKEWCCEITQASCSHSHAVYNIVFGAPKLKLHNPDEFTHGIAVVDGVLNVFIRKIEPAL